MISLKIFLRYQSESVKWLNSKIYILTKLYLHIGTEKTGTTHIQQFLLRNREVLLLKGYFVPDFLGEFAHTWLPILTYADNKQDDLTDKEKIYERDNPNSFKRLKIEELKKAVSLNEDKKWILSSEHLHARLNNLEIRRLKSLLSPLFSEIKVIVYLRNPIEVSISLWFTKVWGGRPIKKLPLPGTEWDYICNHKRTIKLWEENFQEKIIPRLFCKRSFFEGNLLEDFLFQIGINLDKSFEIPENVNQSMGYAGIRLLSFINEIIPPAKIDLVDSSRGNIEELIMEAFKDLPKYCPTEEEIYTYDKYYEDSNKWIKIKYFPDSEFLWENNQKISENENQNLLTEKEIKATFKLISNLLNKNQENISRIDDLEKRVKLLQNHIRSYNNSKIWRFSKPLRKIADLIKRLSGLN